MIAFKYWHANRHAKLLGRHTDNSEISHEEMKGDIDKISLIETIDILEHLTFWNRLQIMSDTMIMSEKQRHTLY